MNARLFIWLALALLVIWLVLRVALAVTSVMLHLLWVAAIVFVVIWLAGRLMGSRGV